MIQSRAPDRRARRQRLRCWPRLALAVLGLLAAAPGLAPVPAAAQAAGSAYTVSGIEVDATAADAVAARGQALEEGQRTGLLRLLMRLVPVAEHDRLPALNQLNIDRYVQSITIAREELSATRYLAELNVGYDREVVQTLLRTAGLPFAEEVSAPRLVLPLYEVDGAPRLWADGNPWWEAWQEHLDTERLLRLVLPLGDLADMAAVTAEQAAAGDQAALQRLAARYDVADTLIVRATPQPAAAASGVPEVRLDVTQLGDGRHPVDSLVLPGNPGETLEAILAAAVTQLQNRLDERWKSANILRFDQGGLMLVEVPIGRLTDWVRIDQDLQGMPEISRVDITKFARARVEAEIRFIGDQRRLEQALAGLGLTLRREGDVWLLQPVTANPSSGGRSSATSTAS